MLIRKFRFRSVVSSVVLATTLAGVAMQPSEACTDVNIVAQDGSVLSARSMEFGMPMKSRLVIRPRAMHFTSAAPDGKKGITWAGKYGYAYLDALNQDVVVDGMNETGLSVGALYLPGFAAYETIDPTQDKTALSNLQIGAWILSRFASVDELKAALPDIHVWGEPVHIFGDHYVPLHYVVHDAAGKSLILEWVDGKLKTYDDAVGVMTNSPPYDWQMANLRNYVNLSATNASPLKIRGLSVRGTGEGSGLLGLPGDPTPPSRLVQTVFALNLATQPKDIAGSLVLAQKLMDRVDIPMGMVRDQKAQGDWTQWNVFYDHQNRRFYYRTYRDSTLRMLDLRKVDFDQPAKRMPIGDGKPVIKEIVAAKIPVL
ncbi:linear amide C-N hydrolase [Burkholderia sp. LMG 21824]|uniref:linear amide C-N hydrolase n=1 Tax=Burkholderia sp. LMG 21824 TaxID=3158172 RepID=UPI003C3032EE